MCSNDKQGSERENQAVRKQIPPDNLIMDISPGPLDDNFLIGSPILPLGPRPITAYPNLAPMQQGVNVGS
jgi:hypothetical protein